MFSRRLTADNRSELMDRFPLESLEQLLLRTFVKLFTDHYKSQFNARRVSVQRSYSALAAVCYNWWQTMNGWPQSPTKHWFKHTLQRYVKSLITDTSHRPFFSRPSRQLTTQCKVQGVAQCGNTLYIICENSDEIAVVDSKDVSGQVMSRIKVSGMQAVNDIVACTETRQLYVADIADSGCVWRVSTNGRRMEKWKSPEADEFNTSLHSELHKICWSLSVRSRRLLVTTNYCVLVQYGPDDSVLRKVTVDCPDEFMNVQHAVETSHGTFFVILIGSEPEAPAGIIEVDSDGQHIRFFCDRKLLDVPLYISLDSFDRVFVADYAAPRVLLLTDQLQLERTVDVGFWLKDEDNWVISSLTYVGLPSGGRLIVGGSRLICMHDIMCSRGEKSRKHFLTNRQICTIM